MTVANTGSVSQSYDGDTRASYLVIDGEHLTIRRVEYDVQSEAERTPALRPIPCRLDGTDFARREILPT